MRKLKTIKTELKPWVKSTFGNIQDKLRKNLDKISYIENKLLDSPMSFRLNDWLNRMLKQREKLLLFNQKYWGRLARKTWLVNGDRNSSYFQRIVKHCHKKQLVTKIRNDLGGWIEDDKDINLKFIEDYSKRFKSNFTRPRIVPELGLPKLITQSINDTLIRLPTMQEIKSVIWDFDPNKTPGLDGFGVGFFQEYWDIIKDDLVATIHEFFTHDKLLRQINHTFITLIPKVNQPQTTAQFRPISLCSTIYKIISKILVTRLRPFLADIISPLQSALFRVALSMITFSLPMKLCINLNL